MIQFIERDFFINLRLKMLRLQVFFRQVKSILTCDQDSAALTLFGV
jgi:hypothetical protein